MSNFDFTKTLLNGNKEYINTVIDRAVAKPTTDDEFLKMMASIDALNTVTDESGNILTDESGNILIW